MTNKKTKEQLVTENEELIIRNQQQESLINDLNNKLSVTPSCSSCVYQRKATNTEEEHAERIKKLNEKIYSLEEELKTQRSRASDASSKVYNLEEKLKASYSETVYARQQLTKYRSSDAYRDGLFKIIDLLSLLKQDIKTGEEIKTS